MLSSLLAVGLLLLLIGLTFGLGQTIVRRFAADAPFAERLVFAVPIGIGIVGFVVWFCGLIGFLSPILFYGLLGLGLPGIGLLLWDALKSRSETRPDRGPLNHAATVLLGLFSLCTLVGALAPPSILEWDALSYHLANPKTWLGHGRIDFLPWDHHSNFPFLVQMHYLLMLGVGSIAGAKLVHWLCYLWLFLSVRTFARRHFTADGQGAILGDVAALLLASVPIVVWEASVAYVDLATALFTWLALYALINAVSVPKNGPATSVSWLLISAVLMGFALGTKYTVLGFWGILLVGILGWHVVVHRTWAKETLPHAALWGGISLLIGLPWYIKNWIVAGNPVYPFAYGLFGGRYWSDENATAYTAEQARFGYGKTPLDLLLSPWQVSQELLFLPSYYATTGRRFIFTEYIVYGFGLSPVFVGLLLTLPFLGRRLSRPSLYCLLFGGGVYLFWFLIMQQTRYLIPALPAFALVIAEAVVLLLTGTKSFVRFLGAGLAGLSVFWGLFLAAGIAAFGVNGVRILPNEPVPRLAPALPVVLGAVDRREYVERTLPGIGAASFWINENTEPQEKVAMFDETRGFWLDREYVWAQPDHAAGLLPWEEYRDVDDWLADFKKRGYTVLLLGLSPELFPEDGRRWRSLMAEAIASGKLTPVFAKGTYRVYHIP